MGFLYSCYGIVYIVITWLLEKDFKAVLMGNGRFELML